MSFEAIKLPVFYILDHGGVWALTENWGVDRAFLTKYDRDSVIALQIFIAFQVSFKFRMKTKLE